MRRVIAVFVSCIVCACTTGGPSTSTQPAAKGEPATSFNLFTVEQDIEIGKQSAVEAEKQLHLLRQPSVDACLNRIVSALAAEPPGARYPYHAKAVSEKSINAFALPGGPLYVHSGLLLAARNEAELAGVIPHELAHIALRHGTAA